MNLKYLYLGSIFGTGTPPNSAEVYMLGKEGKDYLGYDSETQTLRLRVES